MIWNMCGSYVKQSNTLNMQHDSLKAFNGDDSSQLCGKTTLKLASDSAVKGKVKGHLTFIAERLIPYCCESMLRHFR